MIDVVDEIETLILLTLDAKAPSCDTDCEMSKGPDGRHGTWVCLSTASRLGFDPALPEKTYTTDIIDNERLFSGKRSMLLSHPMDILGDDTEVTIFCGNKMNWLRFRRTHKRPKNLSVLGKSDSMYELHQRNLTTDGQQVYEQRLICFDKSGGVLATKMDGAHTTVKNDFVIPYIACSIVEDAHRSNAMLASVKDSVNLMFPVPYGDHLEAFKCRSAPRLPSGRKKALVHWVASHLRKREGRGPVKVEGFVRGVQEIVIDGISVVITPNAMGAR